MGDAVGAYVGWSVGVVGLNEGLDVGLDVVVGGIRSLDVSVISVNVPFPRL